MELSSPGLTRQLYRPWIVHLLMLSDPVYVHISIRDFERRGLQKDQHQAQRTRANWILIFAVRGESLVWGKRCLPWMTGLALSSIQSKGYKIPCE